MFHPASCIRPLTGHHQKFLWRIFSVLLLLLFISACQGSDVTEREGHPLPLRMMELPQKYFPEKSPFAEAHQPEPIENPLVNIYTSTKNGKGFYINDRYLLTAAHVISGDILVEIENEHGHRVYGHVKGYDPKMDVALIKSLHSQPSVPLSITKETPRLYEHVALHTNDGPRQGTISELETEIEILTRVQNHLFTVEIPVQLGQSGSPVINCNQEVLGMVTARSLINDQITFVVPSHLFYENVHKWMESPLSPSELIKKY